MAAATRKIGSDARNGQFTSVQTAKEKPPNALWLRARCQKTY
jgi:hypothetical protein